jgi:hypothetical protein
LSVCSKVWTLLVDEQRLPRKHFSLWRRRSSD